MDTVGRYQLGTRIGAGSFATVYKARDPDLDVTVAVKILAENWAANPDVRGRFLGEARMLRRFSDERIVPVHDIGTTADDRPYFVMAYADAGSLEHLRRQPTLAGRALRLAAEMARGIEVLHRHNVIHRDITPGNVLLQYSKQGVRVMIADLGVAKSLTEHQEGTMTAGTPAYMAYEQATGGWLDQRVDIYSVAAVAYALLAGHPPFPIKTLNDLLIRDWSVGVTPIADMLAAPPLLDEVLAAALSPDPQQRPQSALELATILDSIAEVLPGGNQYLPHRLDEEPPLCWGSLGQDRPLAPPPLIGQPISSPSLRSYSSIGQSSGDHPSFPSPGMGYSIGTGSGAGYTGSGAGYFANGSLPGSGYRSGPTGDYLISGSPSSMASYHSLVQSNSVVPHDENPQQMLDSYLGKGTYQVAKPKQRRPASYYILLAVAALVIFVVVMWLTIGWLT